MTLLRGALENFATAVWLLPGKDHAERRAPSGAGFGRTAFTIDWDNRQATCPRGNTSTWWSRGVCTVNGPVSYSVATECVAIRGGCDGGGGRSLLVRASGSRGLTQSELAGELSRLEGTRITQGYVSRAEAGRIPVRYGRVQLFADALRYTADLLCRISDTAGAGVGLIHHRKRASLGAPALRRIHATLALTRLQVESLTQAADFHPRIQFRRIEVNDFDTPADAAETVREEWSVPAGPVDDMVALLEGAGALVVVRDLCTTALDAVSQWPADKAPLVLLNSAAPADRFRFSLAHELGHLVMHGEPGEGRVQEDQANRFAAEFLMPHDAVLPELKPGIDVSRLLDLKARWGVSMAALIRRAMDLGVVSEWQYRTLMVELSALGYRTNEPTTIRRETPHHLARAVTRLEEQLHLSVTETAHLAGLGREEFHEIYLCASSPSGHEDVPDSSAR